MDEYSTAQHETLLHKISSLFKTYNEDQINQALLLLQSVDTDGYASVQIGFQARAPVQNRFKTKAPARNRFKTKVAMPKPCKMDHSSHAKLI